MGNRGRTEAGDVQVMHAGTGIVHAKIQPRAGRHADAVARGLSIHQDAAVLGGKLEVGARLMHPFDANRRGYLVVSKGKVEISVTEMGERDGASIPGEGILTISSIAKSKLVLVDAP